MAAVCPICPHACRLEPGETGLCRVRRGTPDGRVELLTYGLPCSITRDDPIEKKPLFHLLPGSRTLSVATVGCNLACRFCQNAAISQTGPGLYERPAPTPPAALVEAARACGAPVIAYTYTEPAVFFEYVLDTAVLARGAGLANVIVSNGCLNRGPLDRLIPHLDGANIDLKGDDDFYREWCGLPSAAPVLATIERLFAAGVVTEVTCLLVTGLNDAPEQVERLCRTLLARTGPDLPLHFSRFHPDHRLRDRPATPPERVTEAVELALRLGFRYVYAGNLAGSGREDTRCPGCGLRLIERHGFASTVTGLAKARCAGCGTTIYGRYE